MTNCVFFEHHYCNMWPLNDQLRWQLLNEQKVEKLKNKFVFFEDKNMQRH